MWKDDQKWFHDLISCDMCRALTDSDKQPDPHAQVITRQKGRRSLCIDMDTYTYWSLRLYWKALAEMSLSLHDVTVLERRESKTDATTKQIVVNIEHVSKIFGILIHKQMKAVVTLSSFLIGIFFFSVNQLIGCSVKKKKEGIIAPSPSLTKAQTDIFTLFVLQ